MEPLAADDPHQVGDYRLLRRLGAGGMGRVYLGRTAGGRAVAVKVVRAELADDAEFRARFRQEVRAARRVGGRWTAPVLDADTESGHPWVATGYVAGPALSDAVRAFGPLPADSVRALGTGLARALAAVHELGLVHRDVKPSNVLITLDGPRLIDFGIARALDATTALTRSGFLIGSPEYMSPEQALGAVVGPATDVFALGAVLVYAATGVAPFGGEGLNVPAQLYKVVHGTPELGGLDPGLRDIVTGCLNKDPARRWAPAELADQLDPSGAGAARMSEGGAWLPGGLSAAVGRHAVGVLDLDHDRPAPARTTVAPPFPPPQPPGVPPDTLPYAPPSYLPGPTPRPAGRRRWPAVLGVCVVVAGGSTGAGVWLSGHDGAPAHSRSVAAVQQSRNPARSNTPEPSTAAPATTAPPTVAPSPTGVIPKEYLGTWRGVLTEQGVFGSLTYQVSLRQGTVDQVVADGTVTWPDGSTCTGSDYLESASADQVVLKVSALTGGTECVPDSAPRVYSVNPNGTLHLEVDGGSGDLTRIS